MEKFRICLFSHFKASARLEQFQQIMAFTKKSTDFSPESLRDLIKVLLRPLQSGLIVGVIERPPHRAPGSIAPWDFFMGKQHSDLFMGNEAKRLPVDGFKVRLASDIILPCPWNRERAQSALVNIGTGKRFGPWKEDANHVVNLWLPWGIAFVIGGNHSITAGIIASEGDITPSYVYDLSSVLDQVKCDGRYYRWRDTGKPITKMTEARIGAVFEIGRLLRDTEKPS